jgi:hypothetical protein
MKRFVVLALLITSCAGWTQSATGPKPVALIAGLSTLHHPVSTSNPAAQQFFDQGLRLVYAFNHEEATRSFRHAAELDPHLAMAWWGLALAVGPNYNLPVDPEREKIAVDAVDRSLGGVLLQTGDAKAAEQTFARISTRIRVIPDPSSASNRRFGGRTATTMLRG